jgi:hypothetical protein
VLKSAEKIVVACDTPKPLMRAMLINIFFIISSFLFVLMLCTEVARFVPVKRYENS